jgi:multiple sugar transport system permease protein
MMRIGRKLIILLGALLLLTWTIGPIYWLINISLMSGAERTGVPTHLYPHTPTPYNYLRILGFSWYDVTGKLMAPSGASPIVIRGLINSAIIATAVTVATLFVAMPAAYCLARLRFRFKNWFLFSIIASRSLPDVALLIPFFILFQIVGLRGTRTGVMILHFALTTPLITWVMLTLFEVLPKTVEREARVDGCSWWQAFWRVILPMAMPGVVAALCFTWMVSWNEFTYGLFIAGGTPAGTYPPVLSALLAIDYGQPDQAAATAAMVIGMVPSIILAYIYQGQMRRLNVVSPF